MIIPDAGLQTVERTNIVFLEKIPKTEKRAREKVWRPLKISDLYLAISLFQDRLIRPDGFGDRLLALTDQPDAHVGAKALLDEINIAKEQLALKAGILKLWLDELNFSTLIPTISAANVIITTQTGEIFPIEALGALGGTDQSNIVYFNNLQQRFGLSTVPNTGYLLRASWWNHPSWDLRSKVLDCYALNINVNIIDPSIKRNRSSGVMVPAPTALAEAFLNSAIEAHNAGNLSNETLKQY